MLWSRSRSPAFPTPLRPTGTRLRRGPSQRHRLGPQEIVNLGGFAPDTCKIVVFKHPYIGSHHAARKLHLHKVHGVPWNAIPKPPMRRGPGCAASTTPVGGRRPTKFPPPLLLGTGTSALRVTLSYLGSSSSTLVRVAPLKARSPLFRSGKGFGTPGLRLRVLPRQKHAVMLRKKGKRAKLQANNAFRGLSTAPAVAAQPAFRLGLPVGRLLPLPARGGPVNTAILVSPLLRVLGVVLKSKESA